MLMIPDPPPAITCNDNEQIINRADNNIKKLCDKFGDEKENEIITIDQDLTINDQKLGCNKTKYYNIISEQGIEYLSSENIEMLKDDTVVEVIKQTFIEKIIQQQLTSQTPWIEKIVSKKSTNRIVSQQKTKSSLIKKVEHLGLKYNCPSYGL